MIFWLVGLVFKIVTFPGMFVNGVVQTTFDDSYGVPSARVAMNEEVDLEEFDAGEESIESVARVLDDGENPGEGERASWVTNYDALENYGDLFAVVVYPFLVTSLIAVVLYVGVGSLLAVELLSFDGYLWLVPFWLGFATAAHAFPNADPTDALWRETKRTTNPLRIVGYPIVGVSVVINMLRFLWADAIYALVLWGAVAYVFSISWL